MRAVPATCVVSVCTKRLVHETCFQVCPTFSDRVMELESPIPEFRPGFTLSNSDLRYALQHFVDDFARLLIWAQIAATQFTILLEWIVGHTGAPRTE